MTLPKRVKNVLRSVSVTFDGKPPRNTFGYPPPFFGFCRVLGLHGFGSIVLPSSVCGPFCSTTLTLLGSAKVTKPKPLDLPDSAFFITTQSMTSPYRWKYLLRLSCDVSHDNPPTNSFPFSSSSISCCGIRNICIIGPASPVCDAMSLNRMINTIDRCRRCRRRRENTHTRQCASLTTTGSLVCLVGLPPRAHNTPQNTPRHQIRSRLALAEKKCRRNGRAHDVTVLAKATKLQWQPGDFRSLRAGTAQRTSTLDTRQSQPATARVALVNGDLRQQTIENRGIFGCTNHAPIRSILQCDTQIKLTAMRWISLGLASDIAATPILAHSPLVFCLFVDRRVFF